MWQNIAIGIIALLTIIYIGRKIYNLFTRSKHAPSACQGCCGCSLSKEKNKEKEKDVSVNMASFCGILRVFERR